MAPSFAGLLSVKLIKEIYVFWLLIINNETLQRQYSKIMLGVLKLE